mgnify:CR=1 FL=1
MNNALFVNIVNFMNDLVDPKNSSKIAAENQKRIQFSDGGLYVKEDDQDWGSAGMNDIQGIQEVPK